MPSPGDIFLANRDAGGHIAIVASYEREAPGAAPAREGDRFMTIDGKSFDQDEELGWRVTLEKLRKEGQNVALPAGKWHGVAQTMRQTGTRKDALRGFIDTSKLREALGYR